MSNLIAFGPVPSRRLGQSLGVNNIPPKVCTYSCVYCQLGSAGKLRATQRAFYEPLRIVAAVREKVEKAGQVGEPIDFLTFVPDGEPTLDTDLGREIELLKPLGIKIAVITNSSLVWRPEVRRALRKADWVSLKIDALTPATWRRLNRPAGVLDLRSILDAALEFADTYTGQLVTETMLVRNLNDDAREIGKIADFLTELRPARAYLSIPTRPPALAWVHPPSAKAVNQAYQIFHERIDQVEYLVGYEGNAFASTGSAEEDLLSICAVHPMREEAVELLLDKARAGWNVVYKLIADGQLVAEEYEEKTYYMRRLSSSHPKRQCVPTSFLPQ